MRNTSATLAHLFLLTTACKPPQSLTAAASAGKSRSTPPTYETISTAEIYTLRLTMLLLLTVTLNLFKSNSGDQRVNQ